MHEGKNKKVVLVILMVIVLISFGLSLFQPQADLFWIVVGIKMSLLLVMLGMLVYLFLGMITSVKRHRVTKKSQTKPARKRAVVHVIRKTPKKRAKVIKK